MGIRWRNYNIKEMTTKKAPELQSLLISDLEARLITPDAIHSGRTDNPYPIGRRAVWVLAVQGVASPAAAHKMEKYFNDLKNEKDEKETA